MPEPITQTWELTIPIPHWVLNFFHIEGGLLITFEVTISAHWEAEDHNTFSIEIIFRQRTKGSLIPHLIANSRIVLLYPRPNPYYQVPETDAVHTLSRVSLTTGVTASREPTPVNPEPPSESLHKVTGLPPILPELPELPGITDYNWRVEALQQRIEEHNRHLRELPLTTDQRVENLLACIWSGVNLDKSTFTEENIWYSHLCDIYWNANPQFYTEVSQAVDNNYQPPCLEDFNSQDKEEGEEEIPLAIRGPMGTHMRNPHLEHSSRKQSSESMSESLERHLGTIIEETFQEWTTLELERLWSGHHKLT